VRSAATAGGLLGGHLAFPHGVGVDHNIGARPAADWTDVCQLRDLPMRVPVRHTVGGADLMLLPARLDGPRDRRDVSHLGGPLDQGDVEGRLRDVPVARLDVPARDARSCTARRPRPYRRTRSALSAARCGTSRAGPARERLTHTTPTSRCRVT